MKLIREINEDYKINSLNDNLRYLKEFQQEDREYFIVLGLDTQNKVLYRDVVSIGTLNSALIHPREVFKNAIIKSVNSIIIAHNHPSNSKQASDEDIQVLNQLLRAGDILGIKILDAIIIINDELISYKEVL